MENKNITRISSIKQTTGQTKLDIKIVIAPFFESRVKARIKVITHLFLNLKGSKKAQMSYAPNIQLNKGQHNSLAQGDFGQIKWIVFFIIIGSIFML